VIEGWFTHFSLAAVDWMMVIIAFAEDPFIGIFPYRIMIIM
jgi:hypothetical protein